MECPHCGFVMDPFTTECPRCARLGRPAKAPGPQSPSPRAGIEVRPLIQTPSQTDGAIHVLATIVCVLILIFDGLFTILGGLNIRVRANTPIMAGPLLWINLAIICAMALRFLGAIGFLCSAVAGALPRSSWVMSSIWLRWRRSTCWR